MAEKKTVQDLLEDEIKDLYSAEKQLTKAIPKMVKGANDASLKEALSQHLKETEEQVSRLEKIAGILEIKPTGPSARYRITSRSICRTLSPRRHRNRHPLRFLQSLPRASQRQRHHLLPSPQRKVRHNAQKSLTQTTRSP